MLDIPIFLYEAMYILFSSAIPILIMLFIARGIVRSGRKLLDSFRS